MSSAKIIKKSEFSANSCKTVNLEESETSSTVCLVHFESEPKRKFKIDERSNLVEFDSSNRRHSSFITLASFKAPTDLDYCLNPCEKIHSLKV